MFDNLAMQLMTPLTVGALFLYIRGMKSEMKDINGEIKKLSNGCFARHEQIARELGAKDAEMKTVFHKLDNIGEGQ